jgi:hypothetical protein
MTNSDLHELEYGMSFDYLRIVRERVEMVMIIAAFIVIGIWLICITI